MDHNGPREVWIYCLDLFEKLEHANRGERNSKVGPAGEMELGDQTGSLSGIIGLLNRHIERKVEKSMSRLLSTLQSLSTKLAKNMEVDDEEKGNIIKNIKIISQDILFSLRL